MMESIIAVIYDPSTGKILQIVQCPKEGLDHMGVPYVQVEEWRRDYAATHKVQNGELVTQ